MLLRLLTIFLFFSCLAFAVNLRGIATTEETDSVKFVLQFDNPYEGKIEQNVTDKGVVLTFQGLNIEARKDWSFDKSFIKKAFMLSVAPNLSVLFIETTTPVVINSDTNSNNLKTTISVVPKPAAENQAADAVEPPSNFDILGWRYAVVIIFMIVLIVILIIVKKKMHNGAPIAISGILAKTGNDDIKVISQRYIDNANKLMLIEYEDAKYLILVGSSSMVIDKFYENVSDITDSDLQKALAFTQVANSAKQKEREALSDFEEYKMRAEGDFEAHGVNKWGKIE
jgi:hypothetical protein